MLFNGFVLGIHLFLEVWSVECGLWRFHTPSLWGIEGKLPTTPDRFR